MSRASRFVVVVVMILSAWRLCASTVSADQGIAAGWAAVVQAAEGTRIRVTLVDGTEFEGRLIEAGADVLRVRDMRLIRGRVRTSAGQVTILRANTVAVVIVDAPNQIGHPESWDNLARLSPGQRVEVTRANSTVVVGPVLAVADAGVSVSVKDLAVTIPRTSVNRVRLLEGGSRGTSTLIGLAAGGGLGFGAGMAIDCGRRTESCSGLVALLMGLPIGAGVGAVIGAASAEYPTVFLAQRDGSVTVSPVPPSAVTVAPAARAPAATDQPDRPLMPAIGMDPWTSLEALVVPAVDRIEVRLTDGRRVRGHLRQVSTEALDVREPSRDGVVDTRISRGDVARVYRVTSKNKGKRVLLMSLLGVALAAPIDLMLDEQFVEPPIHPAGTIAIFAGAGVLMGIGDHRRLAYDAQLLSGGAARPSTTRVWLGPLAARRGSGLRVTVAF